MFTARKKSGSPLHPPDEPITHSRPATGLTLLWWLPPISWAVYHCASTGSTGGQLRLDDIYVTCSRFVPAARKMSSSSEDICVLDVFFFLLLESQTDGTIHVFWPGLTHSWIKHALRQSRGKSRGDLCCGAFSVMRSHFQLLRAATDRRHSATQALRSKGM